MEIQTTLDLRCGGFVVTESRHVTDATNDYV